ncbi:MAG: hypothetical protein V4615_12940 [Bacteroidota bacterium]
MNLKVSELLGKINGLINQASFPQVSKLEYDLLMQHVRDLYDELYALRNSPKNENLRTEIRKPIQKDMPLTEEATAPVEREIIRVQPVMEAKQMVKEERVIKEEVVVVATEVKTKTISKSSINEVVQSVDSLNSRVRPAPKEIHHKLSNKPLKELIDLNKRFVLINELFGGSSDAFAKAVQQIDTFEDFATTESFIHSQLAANYQWKESGETVKLFWGLVRQKFGAEAL